MKRFLFLLLLATGVQAQPLLRNYYTTNSDPASASSVINNFYATNIVVTNVTVQTITSITNLFSVGQGGKLTIVTNITILTNASLTISNLARPSMLMIGADAQLTNATLSGLTLSGTTLTATGGGGASTWVPVTTLAFVTTNVTIPLLGGTNFVVTLTNGSPGYFNSTGAPSAATTNTTFTVTTIQDATGVRAMNWDTNVFKFMGGFVPTVTTNANAIDTFTCMISPVTAGKVFVTWNPNFLP